MVMNNSKVLTWVAVLAWMAVIFGFSHQPATVSSSMSSSITEVILDAISQFSSKFAVDADILHKFVRKNAHFFVYLILGILVFHAMRTSGIRGYVGAIIALAICGLYAISDETHQLFIAGRSGEIRDVFIDSAGAITGIGLMFLLTEWKIVKNWMMTKTFIQVARR